MKHVQTQLVAVLMVAIGQMQHTVMAQSPGLGATPGGTTQATREAQMFSRSTGYERYMGRWSRLLVPGYIAFAGAKSGDRVLDVGTGTGALAGGLDAVVNPGEIIGVDPSEGFIGYARNSVPSSRVRFEVGDAQALKFPDAAFDQTMALLVMNFIPDHTKAIAEMRRVTRPQGVVSACVWDYNDGMEMTRLFWDEVIALDPAMAKHDQRNMKLSREGQLGDLWKKTGLVNVQEKPLVIVQRFSSFDDYWQPFLEGAGVGGAFVAALPDERRQQLEARMRKRVMGGRDSGPFQLNARAWCVKGQVS